MDASNQTVSCSMSGPSQVSPDSVTIPTHATSRFSLVPNRVFVGGFDYKTDESELLHIFSQRGAVTDVRIVLDRFGMSKGYGFVTFQNEEDAVKLLHDSEGVTLKDKKLCINQAFCKWKPRRCPRRHYPAAPQPSLYTSYPVGYQQNYQLWSEPSQLLSLAPVSYITPQATFPQAYQPVHQHFTLYQYQWEQQQWNIIQPTAAHPEPSPSPESMQEESQACADGHQ